MLAARRGASQLRLSSWRRRKREQARASRMGWGRAVGCSGHGGGRLVECKIVYVDPDLCLPD